MCTSHSGDKLLQSLVSISHGAETLSMATERNNNFPRSLVFLQSCKLQLLGHGSSTPSAVYHGQILGILGICLAEFQSVLLSCTLSFFLLQHSRFWKECFVAFIPNWCWLRQWLIIWECPKWNISLFMLFYVFIQYGTYWLCMM